MFDTKRIGLIMGLTWIIVKLILFNVGVTGDNGLAAGVSINLLLLIVAIFISVRAAHLKDRRLIFLESVKSGMKQGAIYALIVAGFIYVHYNWIDKDYLADKVESRVEHEAERIQEQGGWEEFKKKADDDRLESMTKDDYLDDMRDAQKGFISAQSAMLFSLVSMISVSFIYSLLVSVFYRKVLLKHEGT